MLAKNFLKKCIKEKREHESIQLYFEKWSLFLEGEKLSQIDKRKLYSELKKEETINYWRDHRTFKIRDEKLIMWPALTRATKSLPKGLQRHRIKFISGCIGNYHMRYTRGEIDKPFCPHCKKNLVERSSHVLLCSNKKSLSFFFEQLKELKKEMESKLTNPNLIITVIDILT